MKFSINQLVVVSHAADATIYRVKAVEGHAVGVIDATLNRQNQAIQWQDKSIFKAPSAAQSDRKVYAP